WPGKITSLPRLGTSAAVNFDDVEAPPDGPEGALDVRPTDLSALMERLSGAAAVLGFLSRGDAPLAPLCKAKGIPLIYVSEYAPETERAIMRAEVGSPIVRMRRQIWLNRTEAMRKKAVAQAAGLQCSGMPTYELYTPLQPNSMVFFDNRVRSDGVVSPADCAAKAVTLGAGGPLRLVFGGRFTPMKGVMDLPDVADELRRLGVAFRFDVYGDGPQKEALAARISALKLDDVMRLCPPVDFRTEWVKVLREEQDLFVCPHPQGDPASTYPEVMSCGVPMVGYANSAFRGIVKRSGCGWLSPVGEPKALAAEIARLDKARHEISKMAVDGLKFAHENAFEVTFRRRMEHVMGLARGLGAPAS
ncbi:MAG: glycosyltransferase, partial [Pseudomonadota bacterium]